MKLSDLKPCAVCKGAITPCWYVLRFSQAMISVRAGNQVLGLAQMYGGIDAPGALAVAEAMAPEPDCVKIFGDEDPALMTEVAICQKCFLLQPLDMAILMEAATKRKEEAVTS